MNICHHNWKNSHGSGKFPANRWKDAARTPSNLRVFGWVHVYRVTNKFSNQCFTIISFEIKLFLIDWYELHKTIDLYDHNWDTPLCNIRQVKSNHIIMLCHILEQLMFYYMYEAVWAYQNMFITYYNENWDYPQKMLAKSLKEITKKCFRKLKDTKVYDFDRFSPLPFRK